MFDPDSVVIGDGSAGRFISILMSWFVTTVAVIIGGLLWWMVAEIDSRFSSEGRAFHL